MIYDVDITIPASTTEANAVKTDIKLTIGVIHQIDIVFPPGCVGLVHTRLMQGAHPVIPSTAGQDIAGDDMQISGKEFIEIEVQPTILTVHTWNLDTSFSHTITWRLYLLPKEVLLPVAETESILAALKTLFVRRQTIKP